MILRRDPEEVNRYVKKNIHKFIKDGKVKINYEIWEVDNNIRKIPKFEGIDFFAIRYRTLETTSVTMKQDIIAVTQLKGFHTFHYEKSEDEFWDELMNNSEEIDDLDEFLKDNE